MTWTATKGDAKSWTENLTNFFIMQGISKIMKCVPSAVHRAPSVECHQCRAFCNINTHQTHWADGRAANARICMDATPYRNPGRKWTKPKLSSELVQTLQWSHKHLSDALVLFPKFFPIFRFGIPFSILLPFSHNSSCAFNQFSIFPQRAQRTNERINGWMVKMHIERQQPTILLHWEMILDCVRYSFA